MFLSLGTGPSKDGRFSPCTVSLSLILATLRKHSAMFCFKAKSLASPLPHASSRGRASQSERGSSLHLQPLPRAQLQRRGKLGAWLSSLGLYQSHPQMRCPAASSGKPAPFSAPLTQTSSASRRSVLLQAADLLWSSSINRLNCLAPSPPDLALVIFFSDLFIFI